MAVLSLDPEGESVGRNIFVPCRFQRLAALLLPSSLTHSEGFPRQIYAQCDVYF